MINQGCPHLLRMPPNHPIRRFTQFQSLARWIMNNLECVVNDALIDSRSRRITVKGWRDENDLDSPRVSPPLHSSPLHSILKVLDYGISFPGLNLPTSV